MRVLAVAALLVVVVAGCGGGAGPRRVARHGIPRALARDWENQASEVAAAASGGDSCRALQLASSLRNDVVASQPKLPSRLSAPLLTGVNSLANRITCTPTVTVPEKQPKPPHQQHGHDHGHHGHGQGGGDGNGGGNDQ